MRALAAFAGAFSGGIFLCQYLLPLQWQLPSAALLCLAAVIALVLPGRREIRRVRAVLLCLGLCAGLVWNRTYLFRIQPPLERAVSDPTERRIVLTLADYPQATEYGARVAVKIEGLPGKTELYGQSYLLELSPGQTVETTVTLKSAARVDDEDVTTFTSKGIFLLAYESRGQDVPPVIGNGSAGSVRWWPVRAGRAMQSRIAQLFSGDTAALLTGILTGEKSGLSAGASASLSEAGLYHILAVSGMHCGFLLALLRLLTGRSRLTAAIGIPLLAFYALLTGASPSVVRACIMLTFVLLAPVFYRDSDSPTAMAAALFCILLQNPFAAASVSLQLSFGAVAGLLWLTPRLYRHLLGEKTHSKGYYYIAASFSATAGALVFTVPLTAWYFGYVVTVSPLSNLLCLPAASGLFISGLCVVLFSYVWMPLGLVFHAVPEFLSRYLLGVSGLLSRLPFHAFYTVNPYLWRWLVFAYAVFALACLVSRRRRRYLAAAALCVVSLGITAKLGQLHYTGGCVDALMLDVGQGESILLESDGAFALVDCGGDSWTAPGSLASDYLSTMGCRTLDYLILTHFDADHINGVEDLLARVPVAHVLVPDTGEDTQARADVLSAVSTLDIPVTFVQEVQALPLGSGQLTVYPPVGTGKDNEQGLAVLCRSDRASLLMPGDMSAATERLLLEQYDIPKVNVLAVGHHGSASSTSELLLEALEPETALISVGADNSYGHPDEQVLERLSRMSVSVYRTDLYGTIHVSLN